MRRAETATPTWADYRAEFPIFESTTYLNTCSLAPLSRRVAPPGFGLSRVGVPHDTLPLADEDGNRSGHAQFTRRHDPAAGGIRPRRRRSDGAGRGVRRSIPHGGGAGHRP